MGSLTLKRISAVAAAAALGAAAFAFVSPQAGAHHEPANKFAAAGKWVQEVEKETIILQETMRVSSPFDLLLQLTSECSILTQLRTGGQGATDEATATGQVVVWVEIDEKRVPVSSVDLEPGTPGLQTDNGEVVLCNRTYHRSVEDADGDGDVDIEDDFIRTRDANAFNWIALDTGFNYDNPANGNNILDVVVKARYDSNTEGDAVADAFVGSRTFVAEPTNLSVHEAVAPADPGGS